MRTVKAEELIDQPQRLLEDAQRGQADIVIVEGEPVMLTLPLGKAAEDTAERLELAVSLYERGLISLGLAAKVAGLPYTGMVDELGRRRVPIAAYGAEELDRELAYVRTLAGSG